MFTYFEMAVEVYLKQETKFKIRDFVFPRYYDNLNSHKQIFLIIIND